MNESTKRILLIGPMIFGFIMALTTPIVQLYFIKLVDPTVFAMSVTIATGLAALIQSLASNENLRLKIRKFFYLILIFDCVAFAVVSFAGLDNVTIRFVGISILSAVSINLWSTIMRDVVNNAISGSALTNFQSLSAASYLWCNLAGGILSIALINSISIDVAVGAQCVANFLCATSDWVAYKRMV